MSGAERDMSRRSMKVNDFIGGKVRLQLGIYEVKQGAEAEREQELLPRSARVLWPLRRGVGASKERGSSNCPS